MLPLSLRARLTLVYLLGVMVTLVVVVIVLQQALRVRLMQALDQGLERSAGAARVLEADVSLNNPDELSRRLNSAGPTELAAAPFVVSVIAPDGHTVASAPTSLGGLITEHTLGVRTLRVDDGLVLRVYTEALPRGGWVQAAETLDGVNGPLGELRRVAFGAGAALLAPVAVLAYLLAGRGLRPLEDVVAFAGQVRAGDLQRRLAQRPRPIEVQRLADAFDDMLRRLDDAFTQQRRFMGDVSHELRTPLTALRGGLDVLLMHTDLTPEMREQLDEMSTECERLIRLTQNLLALAHAEAGRVPTSTPVDLDSLCLEAWTLRPEVVIEPERFVPGTVLGDADLLLQMVLNLLDNAIQHSPEGSPVMLTLDREGEMAVLRVLDSGPGIPPDDLPHVFERFYRGEDRRRRGGAGIGLAIVRWITTAHGGMVLAANRPEGGAVFTVRLPILTSAEAPAAEVPRVEGPPPFERTVPTT